MSTLKDLNAHPYSHKADCLANVDKNELDESKTERKQSQVSENIIDAHKRN